MSHPYVFAARQLLRETFAVGVSFARHAWGRMRRMNAMQWLLSAVLLVFALAVLHLALFLFIVFSLCKLALMIGVLAARRKPEYTPYTEHPAAPAQPPKLLR